MFWYRTLRAGYQGCHEKQRDLQMPFSLAPKNTVNHYGGGRCHGGLNGVSKP